MGREDPSRSRGFNSYSKERRSPGWGREDPSWSRGFNSYSKEAPRGDAQHDVVPNFGYVSNAKRRCLQLRQYHGHCSHALG